MYKEMIEKYNAEIDRDLMSLMKVDFGSDEYNRIQDEIAFWQNQINGLIKLEQAEKDLDFKTAELKSKEMLELSKVSKELEKFQSDERIAMARISKEIGDRESNERIAVARISEDEKKAEKEDKKSRFGSMLRFWVEVGARLASVVVPEVNRYKLTMTGYEFEKTGVVTSWNLKNVMPKK